MVVSIYYIISYTDNTISCFTLIEETNTHINFMNYTTLFHKEPYIMYKILLITPHN